MEIQATQFYIHKDFVKIYYYIYKALETWIAKNIFREDISRVFLSSNEYAFRRRFELTDMSQDYTTINASSLRFPFANYWPLNTGWKPDQRTAALNAALIYSGIYEGDTKIRAIPSILDIPITFYFDREDDARLAYDVLYFKSFNEHYYTQDIQYGTNTASVPVNITIKNIEFNPSFKESDWLKNNRIFLLTAVFSLRSYTLQPPLQPSVDLTLNSEGFLSDGTEYDSGIEGYYLTEEVILNQKYFNDLTSAVVKANGTFIESDIKVNKLLVTPIDGYSGKITWVVANPEELSRVTIQLNNQANIQELPVDKYFYILKDLQPGSFYTGFITFYNKKGLPKRLGFELNTPESISELKVKEAPKDSLIGISW